MMISSALVNQERLVLRPFGRISEVVSMDTASESG